MPIVRDLVRDLAREIVRDTTEARYGARVLEWYISSGGLLYTQDGLDGTPTYTGPTAHWIADYQGVLKNMSGLTNTAGQAIPPLRGSRVDGTVMRDDQGTVGMLFEPAATNIFTYSQDLSQAAWLKLGSATISANSTTAPDGSNTADKIVSSASTAAQGACRGSLSAGAGTYTISGFFKAGEFAFAGLSLYDGTSYFAAAAFNLATGAITDSFGGTASIVPAANGFYFCSVTGTAVGALQANFCGVRMYSSDPVGVASNCVGNGSSGIYAWQIQLETGTVATSPIMTTTSAVTRSATRLQVPTASITGLAANNWMWRSKVTIKELGRDQWLWGCPTCGAGVYLRGSDNRIVFRTASLGADLVDTMNTAAAWVAGGANTVEDDGANGVKITYVNSPAGASANFSAAAGLSGNLVVGKVYNVSGSARLNIGTATVHVSAGAVIGSTTIGTNATPFSINFVSTSTTANTLAMAGLGAGEIIWISGITVKEVKEVPSAAVTLGDHYIGVAQASTGAYLSVNGNVTSDLTATSDVTFGTTIDVGSMNNASYFNGELAEDTQGRLMTFRQGYDAAWYGGASW